MLIIAAPVFLVWFSYSTYLVARKPGQRRLQALKVAIWLGVLSVIACCSFAR
jgi:4-hydroxybenzoate polyprenyltransferase